MHDERSSRMGDVATKDDIAGAAEGTTGATWTGDYVGVAEEAAPKPTVTGDEPNGHAPEPEVKESTLEKDTPTIDIEIGGGVRGGLLE
jgi:hypothetical protein